jgi:hypothetical protein
MINKTRIYVQQPKNDHEDENMIKKTINFFLNDHKMKNMTMITKWHLEHHEKFTSI